MPDIYSPEKRSEIMSRVRSKENKSTELKLIAFFKENHIVGWSRNYKVIGRPDFVFKKNKIAIFVDGCFWHGHDCRNTRPDSHQDYWTAKRNRNMARDAAITLLFEQRNWKVIRIWECELLKKNRSALIEKLSCLPKQNES